MALLVCWICSLAQNQRDGELQWDKILIKQACDICYFDLCPVRIHGRAHPFYSFLQFVINEEREVLRRARVEVEEVLKITSNCLFKKPVIVKRFLEEAVKTRLQVQQTLWEEGREMGLSRVNRAVVCMSRSLTL